MEVAYSVQRISCFSSTPVNRYNRRSTGRRIGSRNVRSPAKTRVIKTPRGFVTAKISARNTKICSQPLIVISEFLRPQQGVEQVHRGRSTDDEHDERLKVHEAFLFHAVAEVHVSNGCCEKRDRDGDPKNVLHQQAPCSRANSSGIVRERSAHPFPSDLCAP
jgi:hypothetical protein